jgi:hypothetical protein
MVKIPSLTGLHQPVDNFPGLSSISARLARMVRPTELARLRGRLDSHDETLRALSDTLLDVKETVDQHTVTLGQHTEMLTSHGEMLTEILRRLPEPRSTDGEEPGDPS